MIIGLIALLILYGAAGIVLGFTTCKAIHVCGDRKHVPRAISQKSRRTY
jgi:hypothetical protein